MLKLPWTHPHTIIGPHPRKTKCVSIQVVSKLGSSLNTERAMEVLDLGLNDMAEEVRIEAITSMPVIALWTGLDVLAQMFGRLE